MSKKANQNRREDKKAFKKFMVILAVCFVLGGISGFFSAILAENGAARPIGDVLIDILTVCQYCDCNRTLDCLCGGI